MSKFTSVLSIFVLALLLVGCLPDKEHVFRSELNEDQNIRIIPPEIYRRCIKDSDCTTVPRYCPKECNNEKGLILDYNIKELGIMKPYSIRPSNFIAINHKYREKYIQQRDSFCDRDKVANKIRPLECKKCSFVRGDESQLHPNLEYWCSTDAYKGEGFVPNCSVGSCQSGGISKF